VAAGHFVRFPSISPSTLIFPHLPEAPFNKKTIDRNLTHFREYFI
jgi:hypothetical protein